MPFPRRGLYAISEPPANPRLTLVTATAAAIRGGATVVQYRDKSADSTRRQDEASRLLALCRAHEVPLIINDDLELAAAIEADGVHLGKDDARLASARTRLGNQAIIGCSCYNSLERAVDAQAAGVDYVAFGRFFSSQTKPLAVQATTALLESARRQIDLPIVAIGGITTENGGELLRAGASLLAVINGLFGQTDPEAEALAYGRLFDHMHEATTGADSREP